MPYNRTTFTLCLYVVCHLAAAEPPSSQPTSTPATQPANLLINGDFEQLDDRGELPAGWSTVHPANVRVADGGGWHGHVIEMTGDKKLMASYGVDLIGQPIPVKPNTRYCCTGYTRSTGPRMKVFVRGYATVTRRVDGELQTSQDPVYTMRKDIEPSADWRAFNLDFELLPADVFSDFQHHIEFVRIKLWAYWPVGTCWFDDLRFEEVGPIEPQRRRHDQPVTHMGIPPRLSTASQPTATNPAEEFNEEQVWHQAVNAFRASEHAQAARLAEQLTSRVPQKGAYHLLAARAAAALEQWDQAAKHANWLLDTDPSLQREIEPWQRDWAHVVRAQVLRQRGRLQQARAALEYAARPEASPHARAAARKLLAELDGGGE
ncbi:MAG: hypothetical protein ABIG44_16770 [Planctomycetota bacterium]